MSFVKVSMACQASICCLCIVCLQPFLLLTLISVFAAVAALQSQHRGALQSRADAEQHSLSSGWFHLSCLMHCSRSDFSQQHRRGWLVQGSCSIGFTHTAAQSPVDLTCAASDVAATSWLQSPDAVPKQGPVYGGWFRSGRVHGLAPPPPPSSAFGLGLA